MSSPFDKKDHMEQQFRGRADKMSIASVLNDDDQYQGQQAEDETIRANDGQSTDEDLESRYSSEYRTSETDSATSAPSMILDQTRKRRKSRPPCKKYQSEQAHFIWYHRTDLGQDWDGIERAFHHQFGEVRKKAGLQCKFYRVLGESNVAKVREQARTGRVDRIANFGAARFGLVQRTTHRYHWMRPEDQLAHPLPCFVERGGCGDPTCEICS